jgi:hypothetical protein
MTLSTNSYRGAGVNIQIFAAPYVTLATFIPDQVWKKPAGCSMVNIYAIGSGAGGGGGHSAAAGVRRGGGGGGGGSASTRLTIPAIFVPDMLHIQLGVGGAGGAANSAGAQGQDTVVGIHPLLSVLTNILVVHATADATGGGGGGNDSEGAAGGAGTAATISLMPLAGAGVVTFNAGQGGSTGGVRDVGGTALAIPVTGATCTGGTGGGGIESANQAGGAFTAITESLLSDNRPIVGGAGVAGRDGRTLWKPFFNFGGTGGGSVNASAGTNGGIGSYGCGGGGGGGGTTGGTGGQGGGGLVIITSW